jgi:hypothetical protein
MGYRRSEIKDLDRAYVRRALQHPRDESGRVMMPSAFTAPVDRIAHAKRMLILRNYPEWAIDAQIAEWERQADETRRRMTYKGPRGPGRRK